MEALGILVSNEADILTSLNCLINPLHSRRGRHAVRVLAFVVDLTRSLLALLQVAGDRFKEWFSCCHGLSTKNVTTRTPSQ